MKSYLFIPGLFILFYFISPLSIDEPVEVQPLDPTMKVSDILEKLGDTPNPFHPDESIPGASAMRGEKLVFEGLFTEGEKRSGQLSNHFVCTSCHNMKREDPDLSVVDPQARLEYARDNNLPYLQGTALYGAVNRRHFYNGDYDKKYGDLVKPARNSLREAIQLCAIECAQGRRLKDFELESILMYLWTIQLELDDLILSDNEKDMIQEALDTGEDAEEVIEMIKSKYLEAAPATFIDPPKDRKKGNDLVGIPENGHLIYDLSCKHCHENERYSFFNLDDSKYSFNYLNRHMTSYDRYSVYQVIRYGTSPVTWKRAYMPQYTEEKLSRQQMADLRAYIEQQAVQQ